MFKGLIFFLLIFFIASFVAVLLVFCVDYSCYLEFSKEDTDIKSWDYASFDAFKKEAAKYKWERLNDNLYVGKFSEKLGCHEARISQFRIRFGDKGMILGPIDFIRYRFFLSNLNKVKRVPKSTKPLWDK